MKQVSIQAARKFSLKHAERIPLLEVGELSSELLCFEAGQNLTDLIHPKATLYQVLEGEALLTAHGATERLGKGRLLAIEGGEEHALENAGGGLLVVLATRAL